jgi:hypothetical protein
MTIPNVPERIPNTPIPQDAPELPQPEEAPESKPILISFERYNSKECELDGMDGKMAKKAFRTLRDIGVNIKTETDFRECLPKLQIEPVENSGYYRGLYKGLSGLPDVEIKEAKFDLNTGRLFFFLVDRIFHVIAVREDHYQTGKNKR